MDNKNIVIIILVCVIVALVAYVAVSGMSSNPTQTNQSVNNTTQSLTVDKVSQDDQSGSSSSGSSSNNGIHKEHLNGGDVAVDSNGMVVGHYNSKGEYVQGGQMAGSTIEEARAFDEHVSKYGMQ